MFSGSGIQPTRRQAIAGAGMTAATLALGPVPARAASEQLQAAIDTLAAGTTIREGRVKLELPALAENGLSVPLTVSVDSPMTDADYVQSIHVLSEKNPVAGIVAFTLGPRAGRARVSTSVRLADSQRVIAVARMADGSLWSGSAEIIVMISACIDGG
jgi:sulfur-oxidizing protein SoxY